MEETKHITARAALISMDNDFRLRIEQKGDTAFDWALSVCEDHNLLTDKGSSWSHGGDGSHGTSTTFMGALAKAYSVLPSLQISRKLRAHKSV